MSSPSDTSANKASGPTSTTRSERYGAGTDDADFDPFEPNAPPTNDPHARLVLAAIEEIETVGLGAVRVRGIAARAQMNVAAVNYHFGSKDALIQAALRGTLANMMADANTYLGRVALAPEPALIDLISYFLEGAARYPRLTQAHLRPMLEAGDYSGPFASHFAALVQHLGSLLCEVKPEITRDEAAHRVRALLSATFFPAFFGGLFSRALNTSSERRKYATHVARQTLR